MTAISKTRIFNMALNELGVTAPIANADAQGDTRAILLRNFYDNARDEVLKAFDWNFAESYRTLTPAADTCLDPRYKYVYDVPNDCLNAREVFMAENECNPCCSGKRLKFKPSSNASGQKILLTTVSPIVLRYTRRVEKESYFDPEFAIALAMYLAGLTGKAITGSQQKADEAMKRYWDKVRLGQISNASEGQEVDEDKSTYLDYR